MLVFFKKKLAGYLFYYLLFFLSTNLVFESIAHYLAYKKMGNYEVYNGEMIFEVSFFLLLYKRSFSSIKFKIIATVFFIFFILFAAINIAFFQPFTSFHSNTYTAGCLLLLVTSIFFLFNDIVKAEDLNPLFFPMFWISLGILFCYLVNFPFLSNVNQLFIIDDALAKRLSVINYTVNVILYLLIGIGIICKRQI